MLVAAGQYTSAAALLRLQFESLVRALWLQYVASDDDVQLVVNELTDDSAKEASRQPMLSAMLSAIEEKAPHVPLAGLKEFKHYSWRPLSSFVHGGIHAINRHQRGFPVILIEALIRNSNGLLAIAANLLLILTSSPQHGGVMGQLNADFADCMPSPHPSMRARDKPAY
ncbi:hypothetical protein D9M68_407310 [compost metagenome]